MKRTIIIYPFLFAIFPVLALYAHNIGELSLSSIWIPLAISFGFAVILFTISWLIFRSAMKAGIVASLFLIIFFADGHIFSMLQGWGWPRPAKYLPIAWGILFIVVVYLTARTKRRLNNLTTILNVVGIVLVVISSVNIAVYEFRRPSYNQQNNTVVESKPAEVDNLPDIYYIILDGYESSSALEDLHDFDNSEFMNYLRGKGFYIADQSTSNYSCTYLSLASSLNMEYINYLSNVVGEQSKDLTIPTEMVKNNSVMKFLISYGYRYVHLETYAPPTDYNIYADQNIPCPKANLLGSTYKDQFVTLLLETTILNRLRDSTAMYREYVLNAFDKLAEMPDLQGPKFVLAHILCPHWPYVFGANGEAIQVVPWQTEPAHVVKYLNQIKFINGKVKTLVDEILSKSRIPPIIILQGDHGLRVECSQGPYSAQCVEDTFRILNAYYLPDGGEKLLYSAISPVNSFRIIFNFYFGADYALLSDQSFHSNGFATPYKFGNVTDEARYP